MGPGQHRNPAQEASTGTTGEWWSHAALYPESESQPPWSHDGAETLQLHTNPSPPSQSQGSYTQTLILSCGLRLGTRHLIICPYWQNYTQLSSQWALLWESDCDFRFRPRLLLFCYIPLKWLLPFLRTYRVLAFMQPVIPTLSSHVAMSVTLSVSVERSMLNGVSLFSSDEASWLSHLFLPSALQALISLFSFAKLLLFTHSATSFTLLACQSL